MRPEEEIRKTLAALQQRHAAAVQAGNIPVASQTSLQIDALRYCLGDVVVGLRPQNIVMQQSPKTKKP